MAIVKGNFPKKASIELKLELLRKTLYAKIELDASIAQIELNLLAFRAYRSLGVPDEYPHPRLNRRVAYTLYSNRNLCGMQFEKAVEIYTHYTTKP